MGSFSFRASGWTLDDEDCLDDGDGQRRPIKPIVSTAAIVLAAGIYSFSHPGDFHLRLEPPVSETYASQVEVVGTIANSQVTEVGVSVNGRRLPAMASVSGGDFRAVVPLAPGTNSVKASIPGVAGTLTKGSSVALVRRLMPYVGDLAVADGQRVPAATEMAIEAGSATFEVAVGNPPRPGQTFGIVGGGGHFLANVYLTPLFEVLGDGSVRIRFDRERGRVEQLARRSPRGLGALFWPPDFFGHPSKWIAGVDAVFGQSSVPCTRVGDGVWMAYVPENEHSFRGVEVDWYWSEAEIRHQVSFLDGEIESAVSP